MVPRARGSVGGGGGDSGLCVLADRRMSASSKQRSARADTASVYRSGRLAGTRRRERQVELEVHTVGAPSQCQFCDSEHICSTCIP